MTDKSSNKGQSAKRKAPATTEPKSKSQKATEPKSKSQKATDETPTPKPKSKTAISTEKFREHERKVKEALEAGLPPPYKKPRAKRKVVLTNPVPREKPPTKQTTRAADGKEVKHHSLKYKKTGSRAINGVEARRMARQIRGKKVDEELRPVPTIQTLTRVSMKRKFLQGMCQYGTIQRACDYAGVSATVYYYWTTRRYMGGAYYDEEFVHEVALAKEAYRDVIREAARLRAIDGVERPVFGSLGYKEGTGIVGHVTEYSDRLLEMLMRMNLPEGGSEHNGTTINVNATAQAALLSSPATEVGFDPKSWPQGLRDKWRDLLEEMTKPPNEGGPVLIEGEVEKKVVGD